MESLALKQEAVGAGFPLVTKSWAQPGAKAFRKREASSVLTDGFVALRIPEARKKRRTTGIWVTQNRGICGGTHPRLCPLRERQAPS